MFTTTYRYYIKLSSLFRYFSLSKITSVFHYSYIILPNDAAIEQSIIFHNMAWCPKNLFVVILQPRRVYSSQYYHFIVYKYILTRINRVVINEARAGYGLTTVKVIRNTSFAESDKIIINSIVWELYYIQDNRERL